MRTEEEIKECMRKREGYMYESAKDKEYQISAEEQIWLDALEWVLEEKEEREDGS